MKESSAAFNVKIYPCNKSTINQKQHKLIGYHGNKAKLYAIIVKELVIEEQTV
jgi:hypothetical protein